MRVTRAGPPLVPLVLGIPALPDPADAAELAALPTLLERLLLINDKHADLAVPLPPTARRTPVLMLARNSAPFLEASFAGMRAAMARGLGKAGRPAPRWYVYENDSSDRTVAALTRYPDVIICTDRLPAGHRPAAGAAERSVERCQPMAAMRDAVRTLALRDLLALGGVAVVVDVDVWFSAKTIETLVTHRQIHGLDVATAFTLEGARHYFDTFALVLPGETPAAARERLDCFVAGCTRCAARRGAADGLDARPSPPAAGKPRAPILPVRSAFGGLAVVRGGLLRGGGRRVWRSDPPGLCEHVALCEGNKTAIVPGAVAHWAPEFNKSVRVLFERVWAG